MQEDTVRNTLVVLSSTDDVEFQGWKAIGAKVKHLCTSIKAASERRDLRDNEYRKLVDAYEETLSKQENKKKVLQQELAECQTKIADMEDRLEKSRKRLKTIREQFDQQMKRKEMLMISSENHELEERHEVLSYEAKFFEVVSCILWSKDKEPHEIQGCLIEPHRQQMFEFDKREKSSFYICNKLWEMMEPVECWTDLFDEPTNYYAAKNISLTYSLVL